MPSFSGLLRSPRNSPTQASVRLRPPSPQRSAFRRHRHCPPTQPRSRRRCPACRAPASLPSRRLVRRSLDIVCKPRDIPRTIDIDVSNFEIGTILKVSQLTLPEGCSIQGGGDFNMLTVLGKRAETERGGA